MTHDDQALRDPLAARGTHVIERQMFKHLGSDVPSQCRRIEECEDHDRHDRLLHLIDERREVPHLERRVVDEGEPVQVDAEQDDEEKAGEERRNREADEGERRREMVEDRIALHRRDHPDRNGEGDAQDVGDADHGKRVRQSLDEQIDHGKVAHEGVAEVALDER